MEQVLAVKEQWRARRKVLKDEFMALMDLPSLTPLQVSRTRELVEAMDAHDTSKPSSGSSGSSRKKRKKRKKRRKRESSRRPGADSFLPVVDVSVIIYDKFQQFLLRLLVLQL